jgi:mRNA interferase MazF
LERFVKGDIVAVLFPYTDFTDVKRRPALVINSLKNDDLLLCQITSKIKTDGYSIDCLETDFAIGSLSKTSYIRPNRLFTVHKNAILYKVGQLKEEKVSEVIDKIISIMKS